MPILPTDRQVGQKGEKAKASEGQVLGSEAKDSPEVKWGVVPKVDDRGGSASPSQQKPAKDEVAHPRIPEVNKKGGFEGWSGKKD